VTSPHPAQGSPGNSLIDSGVSGDGDLDEPFFGPPPPSEEVFPAAMFTVAGSTTPDGMSYATAGLPPGHPSGPMPVVTVDHVGVATAPPPPPPPPPAEPPRRRRAALLVSTAVVVLVGAGAATYAAAHKTVTLDVDGEVTTVQTFQGDVSGLLADEGVEVSGRDAVTPAADGALREGGTVVVRTAHQVSLRVDGERRTAWVTALDADEALDTLSAQGDDVVLLPKRSEGTATLPIRLTTDAPVNLVVGGKVQRFADGGVALDELLAAQDVRVDGDDRISLVRGLPGRANGVTLTVVVQKVQASIKETVSEIPYETVTATDPNHYADLGPYLATEGAVGKRVTSWDVITIDGKVVEKEELNSWVAEPPVNRVIMYGSKARPEPKPAPKSDSKDDSRSGSKDDSKGDSKSDSKSDSKDGSKDSSKDSSRDGSKGEQKDGSKGEQKGDPKDSSKGDPKKSDSQRGQKSDQKSAPKPPRDSGAGED